MRQANIGFKNKKVLVMGLGLLGGGIATTKWLVKHGAKVTVTDLKTRKQLALSIKALGPIAKKIKTVLGKHRDIDFKMNEIVVVNPAVPRQSKYLKIAKRHGARLENEASIFFELCKNPVIGVTGTRGKTTTVNWIYHLLKRKFPNAVLTGNSSEKPMLNVLDKLDGKSPVVVELSSWHLEFLPLSRQAPHIAVITNIYPDHLNRYRSLEDYALAKANILKNQVKNDYLILNGSNKWLKFFLKKFASWQIKGKVVYPSLEAVKNAGEFREGHGEHNLENLAVAVAVVRLVGVPKALVEKGIASLPQVKFREETVYRSRNLRIVNDTTATSPDGTIAALRRFGKENLILIAGGTDKNLEFDEWAEFVKKFLKPERLFLLNGSATKGMVSALGKIGFWKNRKPNLFDDFKKLLMAVRKGVKHEKKAVVLFSPGAASFEKFKNEFDRGEKFNLYFRQFLRQ